MTTPDPLEGLIIGDRYRIDTRLGSGGMATVYRGEHLSLQKPVAIKVLTQTLAADPDMAKRFEREAALAARLDHPHCVAVTDFGRLPSGQPFLVMDLVEGEPLDAIVRRGRLPWARALSIVRQVLRGLARAHDLGVVHRDLKPSNVLIGRLAERDHARLIDFGIAKAWDGSEAGPRVQTEAGMVFGTPDFIAPERLAGKSDTDPRSDLYAATVLFYELLTGVRPFQNPDAVTTARKALVEQARAPSVALRENEPDATLPQIIDVLVLRGLEKDPDHRYASARDYLTELDALGPQSPLSGTLVAMAPPTDGATVGLATLAAASLAAAPGGDSGQGVLTAALSGMSQPARATSAASAPITDQLRLPRRTSPLVWAGLACVVILLMITLVLTLTKKKGDPHQAALVLPPGMAGPGARAGADEKPAALRDGQGEISSLIKSAGSPDSVGERQKAAERLIVLGYEDKIPWRTKLELDLVQVETCEGRREVVRAIGKRGDRKSLPALEQARAMPSNECLRTDAAQAIVALGGGSEGAKASRPGTGDEAPPRRKRGSGGGGGGHF